jgi:hypothetical protein
MAQKITGLRVVLASPTDVKRERDSFAKIIEQVNKVIDSRVVSGVVVPKDEVLDPKTVAMLMKRLNSAGVSLTPSELRKAIAKGKCNG